jgi:hypothetical protein
MWRLRTVNPTNKAKNPNHLRWLHDGAFGATAGQKTLLVDANPYTNDVLLEIKQADRNDLDAAFAGGQGSGGVGSAGGAGFLSGSAP